MVNIKSFPPFSRNALIAVVVAVVGVILFLAIHHEDVAEEVLPEDVHVTDTLALNIICTPTLECLPFYHALESGYCDSLRLSLVIRTEQSQFDIDSLIRRTKRIDGAVLDSYRLMEYRNAKKPLPVETMIPLDGVWCLVSPVKLRIRDVSNLKKRVVATSRYSTSFHLLEESLRGANVRLQDLYHAQINDFALRMQMVAAAQVDAAVLPEPYATRLAVEGLRIMARTDSVRSHSLCFRSKILSNQRKQQQIQALKKVYNMAVKDLNSKGTHAADSALIKTYGLPSSVIDTLRLPHYRSLR